MGSLKSNFFFTFPTKEKDAKFYFFVSGKEIEVEDMGKEKEIIRYNFVKDTYTKNIGKNFLEISPKPKDLKKHVYMNWSFTHFSFSRFNLNSSDDSFSVIPTWKEPIITVGEIMYYKIVNNDNICLFEVKYDKFQTCLYVFSDFLGYISSDKNKISIQEAIRDDKREIKKNKTLKIKKPKSTANLVEEPVIVETDEQIISNINNFKLNGISVLEQLNEKQLTDIIHFANKKYYFTKSLFY